MADKQPTYIEGVGWRHEVQHSMKRRMAEHDYHGRCIYMITMCTEGRKPILGELRCSAPDANDAFVEPSSLGKEVANCWYAIKDCYPEAEPIGLQLMPDHIHGLIFVKQESDAHLGKILNGFKIGCNKVYRRLVMSSEAVPQKTKHPEKGMLFEPGYQDSVLSGKNQLEHMFKYMADNPRRLAIKRMKSDLFRVVDEILMAGRKYAAIGNRWLLDRPVRMQVRCHNNVSPENLQLIQKQKEFFLQCAHKGAVVVSPCISSGEKEIARAALDAKMPLIVILENGFPPMYKPPGKYFEACANGLLLMLAPWPYHMENRKISRTQCLELNAMAHELCTEPWTQDMELKLMGGIL